jgi:hypothetical protein
MFEPGPLCEDSPHLAGNSIFDNLQSLKPWEKKLFEHLKVFGAFDGAVRDVKLKNSIGERCALDQKFRVEAPLCRIIELSHPNINSSDCCKAEQDNNRPNLKQS